MHRTRRSNFNFKSFSQLFESSKKSFEEAFKVHGYSNEFLSDKKFSEIADDFIKFIGDKKLIIHNAQFDLSHLNNELKLLEKQILKDRLILWI